MKSELTINIKCSTDYGDCEITKYENDEGFKSIKTVLGNQMIEHATLNGRVYYCKYNVGEEIYGYQYDEHEELHNLNDKKKINEVIAESSFIDKKESISYVRYLQTALLEKKEQYRAKHTVITKNFKANINNKDYYINEVYHYDTKETTIKSNYDSDKMKQTFLDVIDGKMKINGSNGEVKQTHKI